MSNTAGVVIIGGGQAGSQLAASLREHGYGERIHLISAENVLPYQRPPLSKTFLKGGLEKDRLLLRAEAFYRSNDIALLAGESVVRVDRRARTVELASGTALPYAHLVFATGSRNRVLQLPGAELEGILYLRSLADAERIKDRLAQTSRVAVVGAGFVGLELACVMRALGKAVTVIESAQRPLMRSLSAAAASYLVEQHAAAGIVLKTGARVTGFVASGGSVAGVRLADAPMVDADMVLVGVGASADSGLAAASGLAVSEGIDVDDHLATADPAVSAIGDCAAFLDHRSGRRLRLESVQNAVDQARTLGATLAGTRKRYDEVPWFWSDQGEQRLQIAGWTHGNDRAVVRGTPASGRFSVFFFAGERLIGVESINQAPDHMAARRLLKAGARLTAEQAADPAFDLRALARPMAAAHSG